MRILFLGDMVGKPSRKAVAKFIGENKAERKIDFVIANSDNLAHGRGVTRKTAEEVLANGVDFLTCGDHAWDSSQAFDILKKGDLNFICPANTVDMDYRLCSKVIEMAEAKIMIVNLMGVVFMDRNVISPFEIASKILEENEKSTGARVIILDFHAEATSEKKAMGRYLNGRVSAVLGTHTHVQTSDEEILSGGTAYMTDAGMVGVENSILGCEEGPVLEQFINNVPFKYKIAEDNIILLEGVLIDIEDKTGKATKIERLRERIIIED